MMADEFERRLRSLLDESADRLDGRVRSRLTRARYAALDSRPTSARTAWSRWAPSGALAATLVIAVGVFVNRDLAIRGLSAPAGRAPAVASVTTPAEAPAAPSVDDLELLADNDGIELPNADDYDFYEWAAAQAKSGGAEIGS
jgi:hypothetical protein